jgi:hypothetical protein
VLFVSSRWKSSRSAIDGDTKWEVTAGDATIALGPKRAKIVLEALLAP